MNAILCVDDSLVSRTLLTHVVKYLGYSALEADNGQAAMEALTNRTDEIVLVLLDWNIPRPDGIEVVQWMQQHEACRKIPVIMVTSMGYEAKMKEAFSFGVKDYITKPFNHQDLADRIALILRFDPKP